MPIIAVYTIALNEEQHCERWANSVRDADYRIVLDTGSTDGTKESLRDLGVSVYEVKFQNWRFDVARNQALAMIPKNVDICISMDMDEFMEPGWRDALESAWTSNTTQLGYQYVFNYDPTLTKQNSFYADKIHKRHGYEWRRPVHETVYPRPGFPQVITNSNVVMNQIQDTSKKTRTNYLPLMRLAHSEDPNDTQIAFWLGRECVNYGENDEAITVLNSFLKLKNIWHIEASEAYLYLSRLDPQNAWENLIKSTIIAPTRREAWLELAQYCYNNGRWNDLYWSAVNGIEKSVVHSSYLDRADSWNHTIYDLASLGAWNIGFKDKAIEYCTHALMLSPNDTRLQNNLNLMRI